MPVEYRTRLRELLELVELWDLRGSKVRALSGGMKRKLEIVRSLFHRPKLLFLDEPTSGLDPIRSRDISLLIRDLSVKTGCTTVVTTHDIHNAFRIADRAFVIDHGRLVVEGTEKDVRASQVPFVKEFLKD